MLQHTNYRRPRWRPLHLNGQKMWITGAGQADWFFVFVYTDKSAGYEMSAFIVESSWDGVSLGKKETNMGQRASDTRAVIFEDVHVAVENLIGGVEEQVGSMR